MDTNDPFVALDDEEFDVELEEEFEEDDFLADLDDEAQAVLEEQGMGYVTVVSGTAGTMRLPVGEPMRLSDLLTANDLRWDGTTQFFVGGVTVPSETIVGPGAKVVTVGTLKGG